MNLLHKRKQETRFYAMILSLQQLNKWNIYYSDNVEYLVIKLIPMVRREFTPVERT